MSFTITTLKKSDGSIQKTFNPLLIGHLVGGIIFAHYRFFTNIKQNQSIGDVALNYTSNIINGLSLGFVVGTLPGFSHISILLYYFSNCNR